MKFLNLLFFIFFPKYSNDLIEFVRRIIFSLLNKHLTLMISELIFLKDYLVNC